MNFKRTIRAVALILSALLMVFVFTGCATTTDGTAAAEGSTAGSSASMIVMIVIMIAIFYFFLIRPENKKKKQAEEMRNNLAVGDLVTTIGGIVGRIVAIKSETIVFETSEDRVRMEVTKWAISSTGKQAEEQK
ncbi:MAG: preprotein translocase subunit YajC [Oscillospiraceae bacterium]